ncbi:methyltransferase [Polymorphobacter glacialis]|uniref:Methyltransferase n=1 Tax=Sandarakinorhabdus glacialis TaxID=1614636 RepID=A0A917E4R4_9SPHN|nr:methyltransferase domain-containing protein [Polymorphobacter glacialis]GGE02899.1 methyltransferase [Polymorphobacter glacialis]
MRILVIAAFLLGSAASAEPPAGSPPGIVTAVAMTDRPASASALDDSRKPVEVLKFLGLKRGDRVLDVMTGSGYYAEIIGNAIGSKGTVAALEPVVFADAKSRAEFAALTGRVPNVKLVEAMPGDFAPPPNSVDFTLMHLVYHDLYWASDKYRFPRMDPAAFLKRLYTATKPGGIVGVVDHAASPGGDTRAVVDKLHRIDPAVVKADFARAGFKLEAESDLLKVAGDDHSKTVFDPALKGKTDRFVMRFRKPA